MSTKEIPGPFDAFAKAHPDEPVFALLGRDPAAPAAITEWARIRRNRAIRIWGESKKQSDKVLLDAEMKQCAEAEALAMEFDDYRTGAEAIEGRPSTYQEVRKTKEEIEQAAAIKRRGEACKHLREAAYHLAEARAALHLVEAIVPGGFYDTSLQLAEREVNSAAEHFEAKRPDGEAA